MNKNKKTSSRSGTALLVVLIIVMAITITSLGFLSRSDVELACGENMAVRTQMDYLAESGLEHARGLILNPQDARTEGFDYWRGGTELQLQAGNDWYDVTVLRDETDLCNYNITCISYRRVLDGTEIGRSHLQAELRLDPCIAYWTGSSTTVWPSMTINGDVYCNGTLTNNGATVDGDAFATGQINGTVTGRKNESIASPPVDWPGLVSTNFGPTMYYIDTTTYLTETPIDPNALSGTFGYSSSTNPAGIWYCATDANMPGGATINGTLVVVGNLTISGANNVITARPNFPALIVNGQIEMEEDSSLEIQGLAQVGQVITIAPGTSSASITVTGGLFINGGGITSSKISVIVTAAPAITAIEVWPSSGTLYRWKPAAGAFFKSIRRNM